jgi:hypothetical protein
VEDNKMQLKPGMRLKSQVCETQVVVVKAPADPVDVRCGGVALIEASGTSAEGASMDAGFAEGTLLGKRYADDGAGLELLCSKPGAGSLSIGDAKLEIKGTKALPSSD